jgi:benzoate/toluate 1,2-dioxygenase reductase subunit
MRDSTAIEAAPHRITLRFEDGVEKGITVEPREFVLDAALRQGVPLVHQCRSGSCSTCIAQVVDSTVETAPNRATSLIAAEISEGKRLLCSSYALRDGAVRLAYPSTLIYEGEAKILPAAVGGIEWPTASVAKLTLELEDNGAFSFRAGQYVRVKVPGTGEWRSYSMASLPRDLPKLEFLVRIIDGGLMSEYLRSRCNPGDRIDVEGPMGAFVLRESRAPHIFVAGGTGLAPILSMLDTIRRRSGARPKMLLSFGCASEQNFFYRDEVELRGWWMPQLRVILSADRVTASGLICGTPVDALGDAPVDDLETVAYLCGPPPMIEGARRRLIELGVKPDRIYAERFVAS